MPNQVLRIAISVSLLIGIISTPALGSSNGNLIYYAPPSGRETAEGKVAVWTGETDVFGDQHGWLPTKEVLAYLAIFPVCDRSKFGNCIVSVSTRSIGESRWTKGKPLVREIPTEIGRPTISYSDGSPPHLVGFTEENPAIGLPAGGSPSIWELSDAPHGGGSRYWLSVAVGSNLSNSGGGFSRFNVVLRPIDNQKFTEPLYFVPYQRGYNFPKDFEYRVEIKLGLTERVLPKFFYGRIAEPNIEIIKNRLIISGRPGSFPVARTNWIPYDTLSDRAKAGTPSVEEIGLPKGWGNFFAWGTNRGFDESDFEGFQVFEKDLIQLGSNTGWSFKSMTSSYSKCNLKNIGGFISSNSLLFSTRPPEWNPNEKSLMYRMASLSRNEKGQVNKGNLDLAMHKELVKCLWGFVPDASSTAQIEVLYDDGRSSVGTSSLRVTKEWLYLNVSGYTFSSPRVKVRLSAGSKKKK